MGADKRSITILVAEDDPDDRALTRDAFVEARVSNRLDFVGDGVELLEYLDHAVQGEDPARYPYPGLILLDLNMPRLDGRATLHRLKAHAQYRSIPVVILTTSRAEEDILASYDEGANSYIAKPVTFAGLLDVVKSLGQYWLAIVELPSRHP